MNTHEQVVKILEVYKSMREQVKKSLKEAGISHSLTQMYLTVLPDFHDMIPDDVVEFYKHVQTLTVLHLYTLGYSQRKIERTLGKLTFTSINNAINRFEKKSHLVRPDEVEKQS